jgi:ribosome-associated protein
LCEPSANAASTLAVDDVEVPSRLSSPHPDARDRALVAAAAASAKKGEDIVVLEVGEIIAIIDCFVLVSAGNTRQVRTIVDEVEKAMRELDASRPIGVEGLDDATWVLLDYGDIVVHVFFVETRAFYDLDRLWADAPRVPIPEEQPVAVDR